jgi:hypothetical protein
VKYTGVNDKVEVTRLESALSRYSIGNLWGLDESLNMLLYQGFVEI